MQTILKKVNNVMVIEKSRFITLLYPVHTRNETLEILDEVKQEYANATHYCYAYIIDGDVRASDDGEPSKTAGAPMLNVLVQQDLNHILCVVIRYFGGIKLGAGGLVRAYSNSCSEALKKAQFGNVIAAKKVRIIINYEMIDKLNYILQDFKITYKEFSDKVSYEVLVPDDKLNLLEPFPYEIINDCFITQEKGITS